jgi:hypothetical protein
MTDVGGRDQASRLDRSNCILPSSSLDPTSTQKDTINVDIGLVEHQKDSTLALSEVSFQTILKASWILTLQCFIVADIICFKYSGPSDLGETRESQSEAPKAGNKSRAVQYYTRIDPTESVWAFLQRLDRSQLCSDAPVEGHGIGVADSRSSRHHCNTGIYFRETGSGLNDTDVKVRLLAGRERISLTIS